MGQPQCFHSVTRPEISKIQTSILKGMTALTCITDAIMKNTLEWFCHPVHLALKSHMIPLWMTRWNRKVKLDLPEVEVRLAFNLSPYTEGLCALPWVPPCVATWLQCTEVELKRLSSWGTMLSHVIPLCMVTGGIPVELQLMESLAHLL